MTPASKISSAAASSRPTSPAAGVDTYGVRRVAAVALAEAPAARAEAHGNHGRVAGQPVTTAPITAAERATGTAAIGPAGHKTARKTIPVPRPTATGNQTCLLTVSNLELIFRSDDLTIGGTAAGKPGSAQPIDRCAQCDLLRRHVHHE